MPNPLRSHKTILLTAAALILVVPPCGWWMFSNGEPKTCKPVADGHWLAPYVRSDHEIDLAAAYRDKYGIPDPWDDNIIVDLLLSFGPDIIDDASPGVLHQLDLDDLATRGPFLESPMDGSQLENQLWSVTDKPWHDDEAPLVAKWLDRNYDVLRYFSQSTGSRFYIPWIPDSDHPHFPYVSLLKVHLVTCAYSALAFQDLGDGNIEAACATAIFLRRISLAMQENHTLINRLIGNAFLKRSLKIIDGILHVPDLDVSLLSPWSEASFPEPTGFSASLDVGERLLTIYCLQIMDPQDDFDLPLVLRQTNDCFDRLSWAFAATDFPEMKARRLEINSTVDEMTKEFEKYDGIIGILRKLLGGPSLRRSIANRSLGSMPLSISGNGFLECADLISDSIASIRMTDLAINLHKFHLRTQRWPDSLDELIGLDIKELPVDPFSDAPFRYEKTDAGYRLWSIGANGEDENGMKNSDDHPLCFP